MNASPPIESLEDLHPDVKDKLCEFLDKDDSWEKVVKTFTDVDINLFSVKVLNQKKNTSSPSQEIMKTLIFHKFTILDLYKILAKSDLPTMTDCLKEYVHEDIRRKIEEVMRRTERDSNISYIYELPENERKQLCSELDICEKWQELLTKFEKAGFQWSNFRQFELECPTSPSTEVIRQLADRNFKISLLYTALASIRQLKAMRLLEGYVSETLRNSVSSLRDESQSSLPKMNNAVEPSQPHQKDKTIQPCSISFEEDCSETSYSELETATSCFSLCIKGNFFCGNLYGNDVAIKKLQPKDKNRYHHVLEELRVLRDADQKNVLKMVKLVEGNGDPFLIYPYMERKSLYDALANIMKPDSDNHRGLSGLTWQKRHTIALGIGQALSHLHNCFKRSVVVKSSDVLLDDNLEPKVADACLPCLLDENASGNLSWYLPRQHWNQNENLDSFCLGTIIFELAVGKPADNFPAHPEKYILTLKKPGKFCFDSQAGPLEIKNYWISTIAVCLEGHSQGLTPHVSIVTNILQTKKFCD